MAMTTPQLLSQWKSPATLHCLLHFGEQIIKTLHWLFVLSFELTSKKSTTVWTIVGSLYHNIEMYSNIFSNIRRRAAFPPHSSSSAQLNSVWFPSCCFHYHSVPQCCIQCLYATQTHEQCRTWRRWRTCCSVDSLDFRVVGLCVQLFMNVLTNTNIWINWRARVWF